MKTSTIELQKERMSFSAGHFTVFSETERENLHGHNYNLFVSLTFAYAELGLSFDYREYKNRIYSLCKKIDQVTLIPGKCKFLTIEENDEGCAVLFNDEKISFLKRDYKIVPLTNITVEELSYWFLEQLTDDKAHLAKNNIHAMCVKVFSGPGQSGSAHWEKKHD